MSSGLPRFAKRLSRDNSRFPLRSKTCTCHIERALVDQLGDVGRKLHTGRSRNDQVSTDLRLWVRDAIDRLLDLLADVQRTLVGKAEATGEVILPGYTHLQRAQPILAGHYFLAYCEKFERDRGRTDRLPKAGQPAAVGDGRAGWHLSADRPPRRGRAAWV